MYVIDSYTVGSQRRCPTPGDFRCNVTRRCVSKSHVCNRYDNCEDGSDEENCGLLVSCTVFFQEHKICARKWLESLPYIVRAAEYLKVKMLPPTEQQLCYVTCRQNMYYIGEKNCLEQNKVKLSLIFCQVVSKEFVFFYEYYCFWCKLQF